MTRRSFARAWLLSVFLLAASATADTLRLSHFVRPHSDGAKSDVFLQMQSDVPLTDAAITYTTDHWQTKHTVPLTAVEGSWYAQLPAVPTGAPVELSYQGTHQGQPLFGTQPGQNYTFQATAPQPPPPAPAKKKAPTALVVNVPETEDMVARIGKLPAPEVPSAVKAFADKEGVFVSLTTSPDRLPYLHHTLSTLDLSLVNKVYVTIPKVFGRTGQEYVLPKELLDNPKVEFLRGEPDLGPATKLVPAIEYVKKTHPNAVVITIDDDTAYSKGLITDLVTAHVAKPRAVIAGWGSDLKNWNIPAFAWPAARAEAFKPGRWEMKPCDMVEGFSGVLYPVNAVDTAFIRHLLQTSRSAFVSDDLVFSAALAWTGVPRYSGGWRNEVWPFPWGYEGDALNKGAGLDTAVEGDANMLKYQLAYQGMVSAVYDFTAHHVRTSTPTKICPEWSVLNSTKQK